MKRDLKEKTLRLKKETLKKLDEKGMAAVAGGKITQGCSNNSCWQCVTK